jgi:hypothetical protein
MDFRFTNHAQYNMYTREYSIDEMRQTILKPDFEHRLSDGRIVSDKKIGENVLRIIYIRRHNTYIIVSFYYLNRKNK